MDSILTSIKKLLGLPEEVTSFDTDLIIDINSVFSILYQMGVGPETPFSIEDSSATWDEFLEDKTDIELVKSYVGLKVRQMFDPPTTSAVTESVNRMTSELEWRLYAIENFRTT